MTSANSINQPKRDFMDDPAIQWIYGKPNYDIVDTKYMNERTRDHKEGSLKKIAENLVKTWEMESSHKGRAEDWKTMDIDTFTLSVNGGRKFTFADGSALGSYNMLLDNCPFYDTKQHTSKEALDKFRKAFPGGFAWELLDLYSGPPKVVFTWHHWATWEGAYGEVPPTREKFDMYGSCIATVDENLTIHSIEVYYDPNPMMARLSGCQLPVTRCPFTKIQK